MAGLRPTVATSGLVARDVVFAPHRFAWHLSRVLGVDFGRIALDAGRANDSDLRDAATHFAIAAAWFERNTFPGESSMDASGSDPSSSPHEEISRSEAAGILAVTPQAVGGMIRRGELPARKVAGSWLIRRTDAEALARMRSGESAGGAVGRP